MESGISPITLFITDEMGGRKFDSAATFIKESIMVLYNDRKLQ